MPSPRSLLIFALALSVLAGCQSASTETAEKENDAPPQKVEVLKIAPHPWRRVIRAQGSLVSDEFSIVGAKIAGRVEETPFEIGDRVKRGDVLARLDTSDLQNLVRQAEASLTQSLAAIGLDSVDGLETLNPENSPAVQQEHALLVQAKGNLERAERLQAQQALTAAAIDQLQAAVDVAQARHQAALNAVDERVATIRLRHAELKLAQQNLADADVRAPFDGQIQQRHVSPGTFVSPGASVATLVRTDPIRFRGQVPERLALEIDVGQRIEVVIDEGITPCETQVTRILPIVDERTRSLSFEADLPNPDGRYRAGLFAMGLVEVDPNATTIAIPVEAIMVFAGVERVWKVSDGQAQQVMIRSGDRQDGLAEVLDGLVAGDEIVIEGNNLKPGKVEITGRVDQHVPVAATVPAAAIQPDDDEEVRGRAISPSE